MEETKQLTAEELYKNDLVKYPKREVTLMGQDGVNYKILVDEKFKPSKISEMVARLLSDTQLSKESGFAIDNYSLVVMNILDHFTNLKFPEDIEERILMFNVILDSDLLPQILFHIDNAELENVASVVKLVTDDLVKQSQESLEAEKEKTEEVELIGDASV